MKKKIKDLTRKEIIAIHNKNYTHNCEYGLCPLYLENDRCLFDCVGNCEHYNSVKEITCERFKECIKENLEREIETEETK